MTDKKKPGPKPIWSERFSTGVFKNPRWPIEIWEVVGDKRTHNVLNAMAESEDFKQKVWSSVPPELDRLKKKDPTG